MTGNDKQIEVLIQRHGRSAARATVGEHLDADEMSGFAEGHLPPAARAHYVSHLADCHQCRQLVSQLALSGAAIRAEPAVEKTTSSFWQNLTGFLAIPSLRYAAFAAVVLIVGVVGFVALRRSAQAPSELVASNEKSNQQPGSAISEGTPAPDTETTAAPAPVKAPSQPAVSGEGTKRVDAAKPAEVIARDASKDAPPPPPESAKKEAPPGSLSSAKPAYAPVPPGEPQPSTTTPSVAAGTFSGPRKGDFSDKVVTLERERDATRDTARNEEQNRASMNKISPARRQSDQKQKGPSRGFENQANQQAIQNQTEGRAAEAPKPTTGDDKTSSDEPATRSVGGHKFQRQGTAWVDQKYKASMTLRTVARGSDEFKGLDSDLRSIAQQLSGTIIVVWKSKAYLFR